MDDFLGLGAPVPCKFVWPECGRSAAGWWRLLAQDVQQVGHRRPERRAADVFRQRGTQPIGAVAKQAGVPLGRDQPHVRALALAVVGQASGDQLGNVTRRTPCRHGRCWQVARAVFAWQSHVIFLSR